MFALSRGEAALVLFIFALVWAAGALPRAGAHLGARWAARRVRRTRQEG